MGRAPSQPVACRAARSSSRRRWERPPAATTCWAFDAFDAPARAGRPRPLPHPLAGPSADRHVEAWRTLPELRDSGRVRPSGCSNFLPPISRRLVAETGELPSINQVELHPYLQQRELVAHHATRRPHSGVEPDRPWGRAAQRPSRHPGGRAARVSRRRRCSAGTSSRATVVIPRSVNPARIRENIDLWHFRLDDEEMAQMAALDRGERDRPGPHGLRHGRQPAVTGWSAGQPLGRSVASGAERFEARGEVAQRRRLPTRSGSRRGRRPGRGAARRPR